MDTPIERREVHPSRLVPGVLSEIEKEHKEVARENWSSTSETLVVDDELLVELPRAMRGAGPSEFTILLTALLSVGGLKTIYDVGTKFLEVGKGRIFLKSNFFPGGKINTKDVFEKVMAIYRNIVDSKEDIQAYREKKKEEIIEKVNLVVNRLEGEKNEAALAEVVESEIFEPCLQYIIFESVEEINEFMAKLKIPKDLQDKYTNQLLVAFGKESLKNDEAKLKMLKKRLEKKTGNLHATTA